MLPVNGESLVCSDDDNFGSTCTFTCLSGFGIEGSSTSTCGGDGSSSTGSYDSPAPTCEGNYGSRINENSLISFDRILWQS